MAKTLKQLAQESLDVQNACNLSGVLIAAARVASELMEHVRNNDARDAHPIMRVWGDKIAHLMHIQALGHDNITEAYRGVYAILESSD